MKTKILRRLTLAIIAIASIGMFYAFTGKSETPVKKTLNTYTLYFTPGGWSLNQPNPLPNCNGEGAFCSATFTATTSADPEDVAAGAAANYNMSNPSGSTATFNDGTQIITVTFFEKTP